MPLLYFWRWDNYQRDLRFGVGYHLNQTTERLHDIDIGGSLWAFSRRPADKAYVLVAELIARAKTMNPPGFRYGPYRLWGDLRASRYFEADEQPRVDAVIRSLSLDVRARAIGQAFQGKAAVRRINQEDHAILAALAAQLTPEPRARMVPEDRFEAMTIADDEADVQRLLLADDGADLAERRRDYLYGRVARRTRRWTAQLRDRYHDRCQLCGWTASAPYGVQVGEAHHMHWISRGGPDELENVVLLCPDHHRVVHQADAVFDYRDLAFVFTSTHREPLHEPGHLASPTPRPPRSQPRGARSGR